MRDDELDQGAPLVDSRALRRFDAEGGPPRRGSSCAAVLGTLLTCGLFLAHYAAAGALALPALWRGEHLPEFGGLAASLVLGGAVGAAAATSELGIWGKVDRTPRWLRWQLVVAMCGFFPMVPLTVLVAAVAGRLSGSSRVLEACALGRSWTDCAGTLQLVLSLMVQAGATASYGLALWPSLGVGALLLLKVAAEHDTQHHVYLWLTYKEARDAGRDVAAGASWEESLPLIAGSLSGLLAPSALPVLVFRLAEVTAQLGALAIFQAGTRELLSFGGVAFGGILLVSVQYVAHLAVFWGCSGWVSAGWRRALHACLFVPMPLLDADVAVLPHYVVMFLSQAAVAGVGYTMQLPSELPLPAVEAGLAAGMAMWPLLLLLRLCLAGRVSVSGSAVELAEKVRQGVVELQPLEADRAQLSQLLDFCRAFCQEFFRDGFEFDGTVLRIDLSSQQLEVRSICVALVLAEPLLQSAPKLELDLEGTGMRDADIADLVEYLPRAAETLEVNLAGTQVGDVGVVRLAQMLPPDLRGLEVGLNSTKVSDKGLAVLAQHLPQSLLSFEVILYNTEVGDKGLAALARRLPPGLANLRAGLYKTLVGDDGIIAVAEHLPAGLQILKVELAGTQVTDKGASALAEHLPAKIVKFEANVSGTKVSAQVKALLKEAASVPAFGGRSSKPLTAEVPEPASGFYCCRLVPFMNA